MSEHRQALHFSVQGELITRVAREKFFYMNQPVQAVEMLMDCMVTDEISEGDRLKAALDILQGKAQLTGTYPEPDYRLEYLETPDTRFDMKAHFEKQQAKYDKLQKDYNTLLSKLQCVLDEWEPSQYAQAACNRRWKEYGESGQIFDTPLQIQTSPFENALVDDFISRMSRDEAVTGPEYGWLEHSTLLTSATISNGPGTKPGNSLDSDICPATRPTRHYSISAGYCFTIPPWGPDMYNRVPTICSHRSSVNFSPIII